MTSQHIPNHISHHVSLCTSHTVPLTLYITHRTSRTVPLYLTLISDSGHHHSLSNPNQRLRPSPLSYLTLNSDSGHHHSTVHSTIPQYPLQYHVQLQHSTMPSTAPCNHAAMPSPLHLHAHPSASLRLYLLPHLVRPP